MPPENGEDLSGLLGDDGPEMSLADPKMLQAAEEVVERIWAAGCEAWGVLLNRGTFYTSGSANYNDPGEVLGEDLGECVVTEVTWKGDREGSLSLIIPSEGVKGVIAYMMATMTGEEADPENTALDEEGLDAYGEAINQFLGQAAQALREDPGGEVDLRAGETRVVDFVASTPTVEFGNDFVLGCSGQVTIEGLTPITVWTLLDTALTGHAPAGSSRPEEVKPEAFAAAASQPAAFDKNDLERFKRIRLPLQVTLAEKKEHLSTIMNLIPGSIIEFRKSAEELLDLRVGDLTLGRGEAVIRNERFGLHLKQMADVRQELKKRRVH